MVVDLCLFPGLQPNNLLPLCMLFHPTRVTLSHALPSSSRAWLARQVRDHYVRQRLSHPAAFRSRSAFKLLEIDAKYGGFLTQKDVKTVVDLGAAPGGWSQVVAGKLGWTETGSSPDKRASRGAGHNSKRRTQPESLGTWRSNSEQLEDEGPDGLDRRPGENEPNRTGRGTIIAVDLLPIMPIPGVHTLKTDFLYPQAGTLIHGLAASDGNPEGKTDVILSDMAANFSGNRIHDVESSLEISQAVFCFAKRNLRTAESIGRTNGGVLLLKHFTHPLLQQFRVENLEPNFHDVKFIKPDASRAASSEGYWLCRGWKGTES